MTVTRLKISMLTLIAAMATGTAQAADYQQPMPQQPVMVQPQEPENWYLRGYVGVGMNSFTLDYLPAPANVGNGFAFDQHSIADTTFLGYGIGYEWNNWLRFDFTGEYRSKTQINARGRYDIITGQGDAYQGYLKSWVFLANAFVDLGTWNCFTPYVGLGIGGAYNTMADLVDMGIGQTGAGFGRNSSEWHAAWAIYAGLAYNVSKSLKIDLSYRYLNYGSVTDTIDCIGGCNADSYLFGNLHSQDIMLGLRWTCCDFGPPAPPPPRYVYAPAPPPPPPPPPLQSRG
ncbi:MAG: outer membrane protein [Pseudolabrys sp.]